MHACSHEQCHVRRRTVSSLGSITHYRLQTLPSETAFHLRVCNYWILLTGISGYKHCHGA